MHKSFFGPLIINSYLPTPRGIHSISLSFTPHRFPYPLLIEGTLLGGLLTKYISCLFHNLSLSFPLTSLTVRLQWEGFLGPPETFPDLSHGYLAPFLSFPLAVGFFIFMGLLPPQAAQEYAFIGHLDPSGHLCTTPGILPTALMCIRKNIGLVCPLVNGTEARWASSDLDLITPHTLRDLSSHFLNKPLDPPPSGKLFENNSGLSLWNTMGFSSSQTKACKKALAHKNPLLFINPPPDVKKSFLLGKLSFLTPSLTPPQILSLACSLSLEGLLKKGHLHQTPLGFLWPSQPTELFPELGSPPFLALLENPFSWSASTIEAFIEFLTTPESLSLKSWIILSPHKEIPSSTPIQHLLSVFHEAKGLILPSIPIL